MQKTPYKNTQTPRSAKKNCNNKQISETQHFHNEDEEAKR
jgi:hypothetical protein